MIMLLKCLATAVGNPVCVTRGASIDTNNNQNPNKGRVDRLALETSIGQEVGRYKNEERMYAHVQGEIAVFVIPVRHHFLADFSFPSPQTAHRHCIAISYHAKVDSIILWLSENVAILVPFGPRKLKPNHHHPKTVQDKPSIIEVHGIARDSSQSLEWEEERAPRILRVETYIFVLQLEHGWPRLSDGI